MFGALLLESSAGISLKHTKKIIQTLNSIDKNKHETLTLGTVFRQKTDRENERYKC